MRQGQVWDIIHMNNAWLSLTFILPEVKCVEKFLKIFLSCFNESQGVNGAGSPGTGKLKQKSEAISEAITIRWFRTIRTYGFWTATVQWTSCLILHYNQQCLYIHIYFIHSTNTICTAYLYMYTYLFCNLSYSSFLVVLLLIISL